MKLLPSRVSSVSGVWTLSSTLTGEDENSISERSRRGRVEGIHQARASASRVDAVSSCVMAVEATRVAEARLNAARRVVQRSQMCMSVHRLQVWSQWCILKRRV